MTPTFRDVNKKYSTRYYLSLVLIDEGKHASAVLSSVEIRVNLKFGARTHWCLRLSGCQSTASHIPVNTRSAFDRKQPPRFTPAAPLTPVFRLWFCETVVYFFRKLPMDLLTTLLADARRYFKQSEITLFRQAPEIALNPQIAQQQQIQQQQIAQQQQQPLPPGAATAGPGRENAYQQQQQQQGPPPPAQAVPPPVA